MTQIKRQIIQVIKPILNKLPYVKTLHKLNSNSKFPAGHFYSSVVSLEDIRRRQDEIWSENIIKEIQGIELNEKGQIAFFNTLSNVFGELNLPETKKNGSRYFLRNSYFSYGDGLILGSIIKTFKPRKIIEIGSGFSSALMLDLNEKYMKDQIHLTFIEPFPQARLNNILEQGENKNVQYIIRTVQEVPIEEFEILDRGDILFIDSSHIVKTGSDVNYIIFNILPRLKPGVLIHFHDVHHPFEYPKQWILDGFGWNETYFLRSFLMYNKHFEILLFSDFLKKYHRDIVGQHPIFLKSPGSSLWLEKKDF